MYPSYPSPGTATRVLLGPAVASLAFGATLQLTCTLADALGSGVAPSRPFTFTSSNPALLTVSPTGLCTAASAADPNLLQTGGIVTVRASYPWAGANSGATIEAFAVVTITAPTASSHSFFRLLEKSPGNVSAGVWVREPKIYPDFATGVINVTGG